MIDDVEQYLAASHCSPIPSDKLKVDHCIDRFDFQLGGISDIPLIDRRLRDMQTPVNVS